MPTSKSGFQIELTLKKSVLKIVLKESVLERKWGHRLEYACMYNGMKVGNRIRKYNLERKK